MAEKNATETPAEDPAKKQIKVAAVLDPYLLVLNAGKQHGIRAHDTFLIYGIGSDIIDPDTRESLGILEIVRGKGRVVHLQDRVCTIRSINQKRVPGLKKTIRRDRLNTVRLGMFGAPTPVEEVEEGAHTIDQPFDNPAIGDHARKV